MNLLRFIVASGCLAFSGACSGNSSSKYVGNLSPDGSPLDAGVVSDQGIATDGGQPSNSSDANTILGDGGRGNSEERDTGAPLNACGQYAVDDAGTVLDTVTGLTWQRGDSYQGGQGYLSWTAGGTYCAALTPAGSGWRLPMLAELQTLLLTSPDPDSGCYIDACAFPNSCRPYWSTSPTAGYAGVTWIVNFDNDSSYGYDATSTATVRCVR
jgi:hypothetical protein